MVVVGNEFGFGCPRRSGVEGFGGNASAVRKSILGWIYPSEPTVISSKLPHRMCQVWVKSITRGFAITRVCSGRCADKRVGGAQREQDDKAAKNTASRSPEIRG